MPRYRLHAAVASTLLIASIASPHGFTAPDMGKLLATGGVSQVEGAGGGGLTPWALINALAEDLQDAMIAHGVPPIAQNRLLAKLAPMERRIVTK